MAEYDPKQIAQLEEELLEKVEHRAETKKLEDQADRELAEASAMTATTGIEQWFFMIAAVIMIFSLPFAHFIIATILTVFVILVSLVAGLTSPKRSFSPRLNLGVAIFGLLLFELAAIYLHTAAGATAEFWLYQFLAFFFLLATFFSTVTYRKKILKG